MVVFLFLFSVFFFGCDTLPEEEQFKKETIKNENSKHNEVEKETESNSEESVRDGEKEEGRRQELEQMKDKDFYKDPLLDHLGWTKKELIERHGEPDIVEPHYYGEEKIYYNNLRTGFILSREERVVNILYLYSEAQILGIKVGMNASEIESVLGEPRLKGDACEGEGYIMTYFLGDQREDLAELELWIYMQDEEGPSERIKVFWKKYWQKF